MPAPKFPPIHLGQLGDSDLAALGDYFQMAAEMVQREQARRKGIVDRARRVAAYELIHCGGDDDRWTPQAWDGARVAAGRHRGTRGVVVGPCLPGVCCPDDGQPRWRLLVTGQDVLVTCLPRALLRPVPTVRRPGGVGRARCGYSCRCCMGDPSRRVVGGVRGGRA